MWVKIVIGKNAKKKILENLLVWFWQISPSGQAMGTSSGPPLCNTWVINDKVPAMAHPTPTTTNVVRRRTTMPKMDFVTLWDSADLSDCIESHAILSWHLKQFIYPSRHHLSHTFLMFLCGSSLRIFYASFVLHQGCHSLILP